LYQIIKPNILLKSKPEIQTESRTQNQSIKRNLQSCRLGFSQLKSPKTQTKELGNKFIAKIQPTTKCIHNGWVWE
jgi:hypothetical protein